MSLDNRVKNATSVWNLQKKQQIKTIERVHKPSDTYEERLGAAHYSRVQISKRSLSSIQKNK
ncbi:hypothetical protein BpHYR1_047185 [Brachionus plicatilis]|uniref:Uncharacterized protein n=1 Tax=Brachionus plicatilis TaxID=10195 RepID=A0A3M7S1T9_BRAPC|nr:hypothetical protein BpHYR1_047185 [Brachionus plicatilis]